MNTPAEYPRAVAFVEAAPTAFRRLVYVDAVNAIQPGAMRYVELVIMHITDGHKDALPVAQMFAAAGAEHSAHFVIGQGGEVVQCVRLDDVAYHAHAANTRSYGVELCGRSPGELGPDDPGLPLTEAQIASALELVTWLCARSCMARDRAHVKGHKEADPATDHDDCPEGVAGGFPWPRICPEVCQ